MCGFSLFLCLAVCVIINAELVGCVFVLCAACDGVRVCLIDSLNVCVCVGIVVCVCICVLV